MKLFGRRTNHRKNPYEPNYNISYQNDSVALHQDPLQQYAEQHPFDMHQALHNRQNYYAHNALQQETSSNSPETMMLRAEIDGDPYTFDGYDYILTPESLQQAGLEPCHECTIEGVNIGISHIFKVNGYKAAIAYVEDSKGKIHARSYYQSNSSAQWRYLPDYVPKDINHSNWFGKGYREESLTLPHELQKELNLINEKGITGTNNIDPGFLFFGTAKKYPSQDDYLKAKYSQTLRGDFYQEVCPDPEYNFGELSLDKRPPEYVGVGGPSSPNFRVLPEQFTIHSQLYGEVNVELFPSFDRELLYSMCKIGSPPQGWVGNIETNSRITSTGCREKWVSMGDIGTPLFEYKIQADGYGDPRSFNNGYVNMWNNYLRKTPIIRQWLQIFD